VSASPGARAGPCEWRSGSVAATEALGEALAPLLETGDVLALSGPLGAGKTRFVAGLARGLACAARVRSPSFTLVNEYRGRLVLLHLDLYRVDPPAAEALGIDEESERGVLVAEWGEKLPASLLERALTIEFELASESERTLTARAAPGRLAARARALLEGWCARTGSAS